MVAGLKDENVLVFGFLMVKDLVNLEGHSLAGPHVRDLTEPAIWVAGQQVSRDVGWRAMATLCDMSCR